MDLLQVERSLLNTVLLDSEALFQMLQYSKEIFSTVEHQLLYDIMHDMFEHDESVNMNSLFLEIEKRNLKQKISSSFFSDIASMTKDHNYTTVLKKLDNERIRRSITYISKDLYHSVRSGKTEYNQFIEALMEIQSETHFADEESFINFIKNTDFDEMFSDNDFIKTGLTELDHKIGGLVKGDITIIGARPGEGKTAIALQIADESKSIPLYISLEMKKKQLYARLLSKATGVPPKRIMMKTVPYSDIEKVIKAHAHYKENKIMEVYDAGGNFKDVVVAIKKHIKQGVSFIVVDYLQLISNAKGENKNAEVSYISRMLKLLAMKYDIPVLLLSQLNREVEKKDRQPLLSDLRDSGCLSAETDIFVKNQGLIKKINMLDGSSSDDILVVKKNKAGISKMKKGFKSGRKKTYELTTITGHKIRATANHKFMVYDNKWCRLDEISEGDLIALPLGFDTGCSGKRGLYEARFLGMMLANGCYLDGRVTSYTGHCDDSDLCQTLIDDARRLVDDKIKPYSKVEYYRGGSSSSLNVYFPQDRNKSSSHTNPLRDYLRNIGLFGKRSKEKIIPDFVFFESDDFKIEFLKYLFSTDGSISVNYNKKTVVNISYTSTSFELIKGVQFLLQSFGILSKVYQVKQGRFSWFCLSVYSLYFKNKYLSDIGFAGKRKNKIVKEAVDVLSKKNYGWTKYVLSENKKIVYVPVSEIKDYGIEDVYDIEVPDYHNFIANGIVVHNSIEQDASVVLFLHKGDIIIAKDRFGETGKISELWFNKPASRFERKPIGEIYNPEYFQD